MGTSGVIAVATELQRLQQQLARPPRPLPLLLPLPLPLPPPELLARHCLRLRPHLHVPPSGSTRRAVTAVLASVALHTNVRDCCAEPSENAVRRSVWLLRRRARGQVQMQARVRARVARRARAEEGGLVRRARWTQTRPPPPLAHQRGGSARRRRALRSPAATAVRAAPVEGKSARGLARSLRLGPTWMLRAPCGKHTCARSGPRSRWATWTCSLRSTVGCACSQASLLRWACASQRWAPSRGGFQRHLQLVVPPRSSLWAVIWALHWRHLHRQEVPLPLLLGEDHLCTAHLTRWRGARCVPTRRRCECTSRCTDARPGAW